jgi:hypothetical protein
MPPSLLSLEEAVIGGVMIRDHEVGDIPLFEDRIQKLGFDIVVENCNLDVVFHKSLPGRTHLGYRIEHVLASSHEECGWAHIPFS